MDNQSPKVYYTPEALTPPKESRLKGKYMLYVLVGIILVEIMWGLKTVFTPLPTTKVTLPPNPVGVNLALLSLKKDYKVGDSFPVDISLFTGGHKTVGTDVVVKYDPKFLEATAGAFIKGTTYPDYPAVNVDNISGIITASGIDAPSGKGFAGTGLFGKVWFSAKSKGLTTIRLSFVKDAYTDSNVVELGTSKNILEKVNDLSINIQ